MKIKIAILIGVLLLAGVSQQSIAQSDIFGTPSGHVRQNGYYVGWNGTGSQSGSLDIRNDFTSHPINFYTGTSGNLRIRINAGNATEAQTGAPTPGYVGIGPDDNVYSRLTISGDDVDVGGYRLWMKTGVFSHHYSDAMYVGLQSLDTNNRSDAVISWSDDPTNTSSGIDKLRFSFTAPPVGGSGTNPRSGASVNGYEFMQMTPFPNITNSAGFAVGHVGIGPLFSGNTNIPQNRLHINAEDNLATFLQISNESGTGQGAGDGLKFGYPTTTANNKEAQLNQQENDRLSLYSNSGERIRVTQIDALNNGVAFNPGSLATNLTRIGISHNPATPVTRPLSLLHLGYNTNALLGGENGWRSWMDVGMYVSNQSDHVYLGLKSEGASDRQDAVLSWGDNQVSAGVAGEGPENFRLIFTSSTSLAALGTPPATGANGLEGMRMTPTLLHGIYTGIGGDPDSNRYFGNSANPTATLEVNAWGSSPTTANGAPADPIIGGTPTGLSGLRFTDLRSNSTPQLNPGAGVLSVDAEGDVVYVPTNTGNVSACATPQTNFITQWTSANEICNTIMYEDSATRIGVSTTTPTAKFEVQNSTESMGVYAHSYASPTSISNIGVRGTAQNGTLSNIGVLGSSPKTITFGTVPVVRIPSDTSGIAALPCNAGVVGLAQDGDFSIGGIFEANQFAQNCTVNIGVYASAVKCTVNPAVAGYFRGDVLHTGAITSVSDLRFKDNIQTINDASLTISKLSPKTYSFNTNKYPQMSLPDGKSYGLIAQEVEKVLPELVQSGISPQVADTSGNIIQDTIQFKSINYIGLIPIMISAIQEQQQTIDSLKEVINDRLANLENRLNGCCQSNQYKTDPNETNQQTVTLTNPQAVILNQNVPNPFAEQTQISYYLPSDIKSAEIVFHNADGKQINSTVLIERGQGKLNVYADDLSSGIYTYTLVVDGKVADTKRMAKQK